MKRVTQPLLIAILLVLDVDMARAAQSVESINAAVDTFARSRLEGNTRHEIIRAPLDPRLQLSDCGQGLEVFLPGGELKPGRNTVGVRCPETNAWSIYTSVTIKAFKDVVVLNKPLQRNDIIRSDHLRLETRDVANLQQGYIQSPTDVIDRQVTRHLPAGTVLSRLHYTEATVVKRGTRVNIHSGGRGVQISAPGIAMMDGGKGQQIAVKNASSQRMIRATVVDPQTVFVVF